MSGESPYIYIPGEILPASVYCVIMSGILYLKILSKSQYQVLLLLLLHPILFRLLTVFFFSRVIGKDDAKIFFLFFHYSK